MDNEQNKKEQTRRDAFHGAVIDIIHHSHCWPHEIDWRVGTDLRGAVYLLHSGALTLDQVIEESEKHESFKTRFRNKLSAKEGK